MKISELIRKLNAAKKEYGDIKCVVDCFDGLSSKIELNYGQQGKLSNIKKTLKPILIISQSDDDSCLGFP